MQAPEAALTKGPKQNFPQNANIFPVEDFEGRFSGTAEEWRHSLGKSRALGLMVQNNTVISRGSLDPRGNRI